MLASFCGSVAYFMIFGEWGDKTPMKAKAYTTTNSFASLKLLGPATPPPLLLSATVLWPLNDLFYLLLK